MCTHTQHPSSHPLNHHRHTYCQTNININININIIGEMQEATTFKDKNLKSSERTMASLQTEQKKREKDLEVLRSSEGKLKKETETLTQAMKVMREEVKQMKDLDRLRHSFESTKEILEGHCEEYERRKKTMNQQVGT